MDGRLGRCGGRAGDVCADGAGAGTGACAADAARTVRVRAARGRWRQERAARGDGTGRDGTVAPSHLLLMFDKLTIEFEML